jgi:uncharacterized protein (DUF362 family)
MAFVDGIVGGDGNGPATPDRYQAGVLIAGSNCVTVDCVSARLMGFDPMKIPKLGHAFDPDGLPLVDVPYSEINVRSNVSEWDTRLVDLPQSSCFRFRPHFGWRYAIEAA